MLQNPVGVINKQEVMLPAINQAILRALLYFDIFNYPLTKDEINQYMGERVNPLQLKRHLIYLISSKEIFQFNEFYTLQSSSENVARRVRGNEMASKLLPIAFKKARLIGGFPFVVSVMASGSLSKGYMDEKSDLDFFIITEPGRLWISRMLLVLYKRIFLLNSHRYFCINYFISSDKLEIEEKNQFTATELATVIPLYGQTFYQKLITSNAWVTRFFPNYSARTSSNELEKKNVIKILLEKIINVAGPRLLDDWCMRITEKRWEKIYRQSYQKPDFDVAFKSKKHASKNHPKHYQKTVSETFEEKWKNYAAKTKSRHE